MSQEKSQISSRNSFEDALSKRITENGCRYESLAASLLKNNSVTWELNGTVARLELDQGRILGSLKPSMDSNFTEPLTSAPISNLKEKGDLEVFEIMAWLESEIITNY
jgi:hypothetical protein